ncbi:hypothetical protein STVA_41470 [Allostella vacuolata]|nr:hypothetical protein STVA_41470 [Stella vacuolata]
MPVESAADRAAFFDPSEFGAEGSYTPPAGTPATPVELLRWKPEEMGWRPLAGDADLFAGARLSSGAQVLAWVVSILRDQVALAESGGTLTMDDLVYPVRRAQLAEDGEIWLLGLGAPAAVP